MFYRNHTSKQLTLQIVSLAAGLALAAAVIANSGVLKPKSSSNPTSPLTQSVERVTPRFGTAADATYAVQALRPATQFVTSADAVYAAMGLAYILPRVESVDVDSGSYLGLGQAQVGQSFGTAADAIYAMESLLPRSKVAAVTASPNLGDFLGIGQPGEVTSAEPQFATMADADFASR